MTNYDEDDMKAMFATFTLADHVAHNIVVMQGISTLDILRKMDDAGVTQLCKNVRKQGNATDHDSDDDNSVVQDSNISPPSEAYIRQASYYLKFMERTSNKVHPKDVTIDKIEALIKQRETEEAHKAIPLPPAKDFFQSHKTWYQNFESIDNILRQQRGSSGNPLSYCVRMDEGIADDPPEGWYSYDDQLINRAPIRVEGRYTDQFIRDNTAVWNIIVHLAEPHQCYAQVCMHTTCTRLDGRQAHMNLYKHFCGINMISNQLTAAKNKLRTVEYTGETKRYNFARHVAMQTEQHNHPIAKGSRQRDR